MKSALTTSIPGNFSSLPFVSNGPALGDASKNVKEV